MTTLTNAALPAATTLVPTTTAVELPAGLTVVDAVRITAAISAARTELTRIFYAQAWSQWQCWCAARGIPALPGQNRPWEATEYLVNQYADGRGLRRWLGSAIARRD